MKEDELKDFETIVDTIGPMQFVCQIDVNIE